MTAINANPLKRCVVFVFKNIFFAFFSILFLFLFIQMTIKNDKKQKLQAKAGKQLKANMKM